MAPQEEIPLTANILGTIGTVAGVFSSYHMWYNWRRKDTDGLPGLMLMLWALCGLPFGVYNVIQNFNIPLQIQPQIFCALALVCWAQTLVYHDQWSTLRATVLTIVIGVAFGGVETLLILTLREPYADGVNWPVTLIGVIAAVLLALGLVPPYFELAKRGGRVIGINFAFLAIDFLGALFSMFALVAQEYFDVLGGILYIVCMLLEIGIFLAHFVWLYRTRKVRKVAKDAEQTYDQYLSAQKALSSNAIGSDESLVVESSSPCQNDLEKGVRKPEPAVPPHADDEGTRPRE